MSGFPGGLQDFTFGGGGGVEELGGGEEPRGRGLTVHKVKTFLGSI